MRWNDVQMMMWGWGDRAWWVIESVFLCSPDKGFWACLGDITPDMPRRPETRVSLCYLMLKLCGISRSSAILGSDSPQSNNRKDHSLWVTPFIPRERPNVKHAIAGYLRLPRPTSAPALIPNDPPRMNWRCGFRADPLVSCCSWLTTHLPRMKNPQLARSRMKRRSRRSIQIH